MTKQEFLDNLRASLGSRVSASLVEENVRYYEDYINSQIRMNRSEEAVIAELGDPRLLARSIADAEKRSGAGAGEEQEGYTFGRTDRNEAWNSHFGGRSGRSATGSGSGAGWSGSAGSGSSAGWSGSAGSGSSAGWSGSAGDGSSAGWSGSAGGGSSAGWSGSAGGGSSAGWSGSAGGGSHGRRLFHMPLWLLLILILVVICLIIGAVFSILSYLAPILIPVLLIVLAVRWLRDT